MTARAVLEDDWCHFARECRLGGSRDQRVRDPHSHSSNKRRGHTGADHNQVRSSKADALPSIHLLSIRHLIALAMVAMLLSRTLEKPTPSAVPGNNRTTP